MTNSQSSSMNGIESLPIDLITKIFSNLPVMTIGKFRCVSKLWGSTLGESYFTDLFLTRSSGRPHLLFSLVTLRGTGDWCCLPSPQPQNPDENSSIVVDFRMDLGLHSYYMMLCAPVSGLIPRFYSSSKSLESRICNPTTRQYVDLPILKVTNDEDLSWKFFGYDPIGKQYKILFVSSDRRETIVRYDLLTFPCEKNESLRSIQSPTRHKLLCSGICINGILYYVARKENASSLVIVCFDVRSEEFKFIDEPDPQSLWSKRRPALLTNFKGKLVPIRWRAFGNIGRKKLELVMWVLEDVKKPKWSNHVYRLTLPFDCYAFVVGMVGTGEIVMLSTRNITSEPFYVFYFNPERNTLKNVEIKGLEAFKHHKVNMYLDHVENVSFIA